MPSCGADLVHASASAAPSPDRKFRTVVVPGNRINVVVLSPGE
jgi:hypothetical protein